MVTPRPLRSSRRPAQALPKEQPWARTLPTPESIAEEGVLAKSGLPQACHWERDQERLRPLEGRAEAEWGRGWGRGPRGARGAVSEGAEAGKTGGTAGLTEVSATGTDGGVDSSEGRVRRGWPQNSVPLSAARMLQGASWSCSHLGSHQAHGGPQV